MAVGRAYVASLGSDRESRECARKILIDAGIEIPNEPLTSQWISRLGESLRPESKIPNYPSGVAWLDDEENKRQD